MISAQELIVAAVLWPFLSYGLGSCLAFAAKHWAKWARPIPPPVLGAVADVLAVVGALGAVVVG